MNKSINISCLCVFAFLAFLGCEKAGDRRVDGQKETLSDKRDLLVSDMNSCREEYLREMAAYYSDYRAFVDPKTDDVVVEFTYREGLKLDEPEVMDKRRGALVEQYSSDPDLRALLLNGVKIRNRYLKPDSTFHHEMEVSKSDLDR